MTTVLQDLAAQAVAAAIREQLKSQPKEQVVKALKTLEINKNLQKDLRLLL